MSMWISLYGNVDPGNMHIYIWMWICGHEYGDGYKLGCMDVDIKYTIRICRDMSIDNIDFDTNIWMWGARWTDLQWQ